MAIELIIALLVGINEAIKRAFKLDPRYIPLISIVLGALAVCVTSAGFTAVGIVTGMLGGLAAVGLYDFGKKTILNK